MARIQISGSGDFIRISRAGVDVLAAASLDDYLLNSSLFPDQVVSIGIVFWSGDTAAILLPPLWSDYKCDFFYAHMVSGSLDSIRLPDSTLMNEDGTGSLVQLTAAFSGSYLYVYRHGYLSGEGDRALFFVLYGSPL